ncbi:putative purine permease [Wallemia mellicola]|uniref:Putative purine permease n=1 Tax=Wallemia mellicola TaxID=1708541 RepID=A0A4T0NLL4_9BASI|nr:putative purine permease [Wallemia mellicola]TIC41402.1 putative purine permease [Wallemia mellicola]
MQTLKAIITKLTTKDGWLGNNSFNYANLFKPQFPYSLPNKPRKRTKPSPFFSLDTELPILILLVTGFQHALACLAGVITPPMIISSSLNFPPDLQSYMVSSSLICSGILSIIQMLHLKIPYTNKFVGTGIVTIVGVSFNTIPVFSSMANRMYNNGTCPMDDQGNKLPCPEAYGYFIGTCMLASLLEIGISLLPSKVIKRICPRVVSSTVIIMIACNLIQSSGFVNWAGGSDCTTACPSADAPRPLPYGAIEFIGLGFLAVLTILFVEIFGSPFMKSGSLIIALAVGSIVAAACGYCINKIRESPVITFIWVHTFKLRLDPPSILPIMAIYLVNSIEALGDVTAASEASRLSITGDKFDERIQGGILADGLAGIFAGAMTQAPMSIFAQNNGIIALTRVANRSAGMVCACYLILFGILGKISGVFLSIPNPVLGGVTSFLFANVLVSGVRILGTLSWQRRDRIILSTAWMFAFGVLLVPDWAANFFRGVQTNGNEALEGWFETIETIVSTPSIIGCLMAILMNLIIPSDVDEDANENDIERGILSEVPSFKSTDMEK